MKNNTTWRSRIFKFEWFAMYEKIIFGINKFNISFGFINRHTGISYNMEVIISTPIFPEQ